jgi:hypothetical protein
LKSITKEGKEKKADKHPPLLVAFYQSVWVEAWEEVVDVV